MTEEVTKPEIPAPAATPIVPAPVVQAPAPVVPVATPAAADTLFETTAAKILDTIPSHLRGLIPEGSTEKKVEWYFEAQKTGVFSTGAPDVPLTDSGKPTVTPVEPNLNDLPAMARMSRGYGQ